MTTQFFQDVIEGLQKPQKELPCKYFYDERGSQIFEEICEVEEYYLTRTELAIMREHADEMAQCLEPGCLLIELGSGSSLKTRFLLDHAAEKLSAYVPVDISEEHLQQSAQAINESYPNLEVLPLAADFTQPLSIPQPSQPERQRAFYFPGSTLGNFDQTEARRLLTQLANVCSPSGGLLLGIDLKKDRKTLEQAYNDQAGVTATFNLNLLHRIQNELGAQIEISAFRHEAKYNEDLGCVELFLVSRKEQRIQLKDHVFNFSEGERILTERSHKYDVEEMRTWTPSLGFRVEKVWTDSQKRFAVLYLARESNP